MGKMLGKHFRRGKAPIAFLAFVGLCAAIHCDAPIAYIGGFAIGMLAGGWLALWLAMAGLTKEIVETGGIADLGLTWKRPE